MVFTTTDNEEAARFIAKTLIGNKLAACVQLNEVQSFFYHEAGDSPLPNFASGVKLWNRCIKEAKEIRLFIKPY